VKSAAGSLGIKGGLASKEKGKSGDGNGDRKRPDKRVKGDVICRDERRQQEGQCIKGSKMKHKERIEEVWEKIQLKFLP